MRLVRLACVALLPLLAMTAQAQERPSSEPGVTGLVLGPDGAPVAQGSVMLFRSADSTVTAAIDQRGLFRILADVAGRQQLFISVPGLATYRAILDVPSSRTMHLPPLTLRHGAHVRVRFASIDGEPLPGTGVRRRMIDAQGASILDPQGHVREQIEDDGTLVIGPLPVGRLLWSYDRAPLAPTRLPDIVVTGTQPVIDRGVITIQPASRLTLDVRAADGSPVTNHSVSLEDAIQPSTLSFPPVRTSVDGVAVFDRVPAGRLRVWTQTLERCGTQFLPISRLVSGSSAGAPAIQIVIGGRAVLQVTSALGPIAGRRISLAPDVPVRQPAFAEFMPAGSRVSRPAIAPAACASATDAEGRVVFEPFPPGTAQARVSLFNSSYIAQVSVPQRAREIPLIVPDGLIPVHVSDHTTQRPIASADVTWTGQGGRVEAIATPNGDVLLEAVGSSGGTLTVSAGGYQPLEGAYAEAPALEQSVSLQRLAPERLSVRVTFDGKAVPGAVVELHPRTPGDEGSFSTTSATGDATFSEVAPGERVLSAHREGFESESVRVSDNARAAIQITLKKR